MSKLKIARYICWAVSMAIFVWALTNPLFRNSVGFPTGEICLPISISIALVFLGGGLVGPLRKSAFWFFLALTGQAIALQMIEAGPNVRYQHYKPFYRLLTETHPILLFYLAVQTGLVLSGFRTRWSKIQGWLRNNFKVWQLICIGLVFFLSSATVSEGIFRYVSELFFATFIQIVSLGNIVLMVWDLPKEVLDSWKQKLDKFLNKPGKNEIKKSAMVDRFVILAAVWITITAAFLSLFVYERHPHVPDEAIYLYHAKYLANGMLTTPAPTVPDAFEIYLMQVKSGKWYPVPQAGWPAILAIGVLLGVPWLINPLLAGLNIILTYILLQKIYSRYVARLSTLLLCVSPWYVFMGMNFMTEMATFTCALAGALSVYQAKMTGKTKWGWIGGIFIGMASLIRPLDGLIIAALLGVWAIGIGGRRLKVSGIVALILGSIMVGSVVLPYNKFLTGDPTKFPIMAYFDEKIGPKSNAYGFGPERGFGWPIDPFPGHSPIDALVNANLNTFSINIELFGWSAGSLCLIALFIFSGALKKEDFIMFATIAAVFIAYFFNYFSGGPDFGARYWFLMIIPLIVFTVRGVKMLQEKFKLGSTGSSINSTRVYIVLFSLSLLTLINFFPWRAIDKYHHYRGARPDIRKLSNKYNFGKSLVLIRGNSSDYQSAWAYNPIDFEGEAPVYAWDRNWDIRSRLVNAYPDRPVWIINGASITNASFKVVAGPLSSQQFLSEKQAMTYDLSFSTYLGGTDDLDQPRDIFVDRIGNIYVVGGTNSSNFPTTQNAYDTTFNPGFTGGFGPCDVFVSKFNPDGKLIWSTFLGGPGYDRAYAVEVDDFGYVYVAGRAGPGFPVKNGFQPTFEGVDHGSYGMQNAFVTKIRPDGSDLVWSSYVGVSTMCRDLAIDKDGDVYVPGGRWNTAKTPPSEWFANAYQKTPPGGKGDGGVIKIKGDGSRVIWATWLGGSALDSSAASIRVDDKKYVYIVLNTKSKDIPTTSNSYDRTHNGGVDYYIAKINPDGSDLVFGTYLGGSGQEYISTHNLAIDAKSNLYVSTWTNSSNFPTTPGVVQRINGGGQSDMAFAKFSPTGALLASTFIGGSGGENPDGIYVDESGNVYISGDSGSTNFPVTSDAFQSNKIGGDDVVWIKLSSDFKKVLYSTYIGGSNDDQGTTGFLSQDGNIYIAGRTRSRDWPVLNAFQKSFAGGKRDGIVVKFSLNSPGSNAAFLLR